MKYRRVKLFDRKTGKSLGYLGTADNYAVIVAAESDGAFCKWEIRSDGLYLAKDTTPDDRWLGRDYSQRADWGSGGGYFEAVVLNADNSISRKNAPHAHLYAKGIDLYWSDDDSNDKIVRISPLMEHSAWLKGVSDDKLICDINLPGTHDSAAIRPVTTLYACHYSDITEQLLNGVRVLDVRIRVKPKTGGYDFATCHGDFLSFAGINEYQSLPSLLDECKKFLASKSTEFIAMSLKIDDWNGVPDADKATALADLKTLLNAYPIFPPTAAMPKLQYVRGQIYLLDRITPALPATVASSIPVLDFGPPIDIPDNTDGALLASTATRAFGVYVQDKYKDLRLLDPSVEKFALFQAAIPNKTAGALLLNFASATQKALAGVYVQDKIIEYLDKSRPTVLGWSLFDYELKTAEASDGPVNCVELVITSNFAYSH